jgi:hypothetical protein
MKQARCSGSKHGKNIFDCHYDWPEDCFVQCGEGGVVFKDQDTYVTAFFEAFPLEPKTFIRGEGKTIQDAEKDTWKKYLKILNCKEHDYQRYHSEHAICKLCGLFTTNYFPPETSCHVCNKKECSFETIDRPKKILCAEHFVDYAEKLQNENNHMFYKYVKEKGIELKIFLKYKNYDKDYPDYKISREYQEQNNIFQQFYHNFRVILYEEIKKQNKVKNYIDFINKFDEVKLIFHKDVYLLFLHKKEDKEHEIIQKIIQFFP